MPYVITGSCIKDDLCATACPEECISNGTVTVDGQCYDQYFIDPERCTDCGICEQGCPSVSIYMQYDLPSDMTHFAKVNKAFFG